MQRAFSSADILLPRVQEMRKWSVVACDQFTSQPEYWEKTSNIVGGEPSSLRLILPEIYLGKPETEERIKKVNENIRRYLSDGIFEEYKDALVYVERIQSDGKMRAGVVGKIDLEQYDYAPGSKSKVRATEATVVERIPPRLEIRRDAEIEISHIMILIDDKNMGVIEPLAALKPQMKTLYDFELLQGGGKIAGYLVPKNIQKDFFAALDKYSQGLDMPYAMGDGNHSLATAKAHYEALKAANPGLDFSHHPARYALCELVNLHSPALEFEAIHRIVKVSDPYKFILEMSMKLWLSGLEAPQSVKIHRNFNIRNLYIRKPLHETAVGSVQIFIDNYIKENGGMVDYIHGGDVLRRLASEEGVIGFEFEPIKKDELFPAVLKGGPLPRKTFSMGTAQDKRYYLEARRIR